ncbi:unnamed protein product [Miscanthus lutarioriparius]|uniref:Protein kinase domain-containing protein n=1 Tax=Miscanthus lutarioriparius TaxID=422564 RepID=A0A811RMW1_9POAL|nr:unnamed protein product [Miscanthus lutarioriparius]
MDTSRIGGTIGYLPPESLQRRATGGTAKSDVFSFGIVLLEVATGRRAVDLAYPDDQIFMLDWVRRLSDEGKLLDAADAKLPDGGAGVLFDVGRVMHLGLLCSLHDPRARPTMRWVVENLSDGCSGGDLPRLPSFVALPKYISLTTSSASDSGATTVTTDRSTATTSLSNPVYATAAADTIYHTAEDEGRTGSRSASADSGRRSSSRLSPVAAIPHVDMPREIPYKEIVAITNDFSESQVVAELDFGTGKVQLFEQLDRPVEALADRRLDGKFDRRELVRMARLGIACTRSDPAARPSMRKIVSILDGNDEVLDKFEQRKESTEDWQRRNATNLALVRRFQALGIH